MKTKISKKTVLFVHPVLIIGSYDIERKPNIMAVSWGGICCSEPPCIAISLRKATYTYHNIMHSNAFTVNIPPQKYMKEADYVGVYSGRYEDKFESTGLTPVKSEFVDAPYIAEFPQVLHCSVKHILEIGLHTLFVGEIIENTTDEDILNERMLPDINKIEPFFYNSSERAYYSTGTKLGKAFVQVKRIKTDARE